MHHIAICTDKASSLLYTTLFKVMSNFKRILRYFRSFERAPENTQKSTKMWRSTRLKAFWGLFSGRGQQNTKERLKIRLECERLLIEAFLSGYFVVRVLSKIEAGKGLKRTLAVKSLFNFITETKCFSLLCVSFWRKAIFCHVSGQKGDLKKKDFGVGPWWAPGVAAWAWTQKSDQKMRSFWKTAVWIFW